jgi:hypothetical protein
LSWTADGAIKPPKSLHGTYKRALSRKGTREIAMSKIEAENTMTGTTPGAREGARSAFRTWAVTLGVSGAMLAAMYGLAFWHEARAEAARTAPPAAVSTLPH